MKIQLHGSRRPESLERIDHPLPCGQKREHMTQINEIYLLRENWTNGVHKAVAIQNLLCIPVINTPVNVTEPDHINAQHLISLKYEILMGAFTGIGVCAVADLVTTVGGRSSRKPPSDIAPHELARYIADHNIVYKGNNVKYIEESTIIFGKKPGRRNPQIGISTLKVSLPTKLLKNHRFIEDIHGASGLGMKNAQIPGAIEIGTAYALAREAGLDPQLTPPSNFNQFVENNPRYLIQRMELYEELGRLNKVIMKNLTPREIVIFLDSALNSSGHMIKPLWKKFNH